MGGCILLHLKRYKSERINFGETNPRVYHIICHPSKFSQPQHKNPLSPPRLLKKRENLSFTWRRQQQSSAVENWAAADAFAGKSSKDGILRQVPANPWEHVCVLVCVLQRTPTAVGRSGTLRGNWRTARAAGVDEQRTDRGASARAHPYCRAPAAADPSEWDPTNLLSTHRARIRLMDALNLAAGWRRRTWPTRFSGTGPQITRRLSPRRRNSSD